MESRVTAASEPPTAERRQVVNFAFYRAEPAWRLLAEEEKSRGRDEFIQVVDGYQDSLIVTVYSTLGLRPDVDFMLWRVGYDLDAFFEMSARLNKTGLGRYLTTPYSYLAMTRRSIYVSRHTHPGQEGTRLEVEPRQGKYLFVYPFVKTREWYHLTQVTRQGMMDEHIAIGHKYPSVRLHTTYSFGLDDQEFLVAFETDKPEDFQDLVMDLRSAEASRYTLRDTPIFSCIRTDLRKALEALG